MKVDHSLPVRRSGSRTELEGIEGFLVDEMGNSVAGSLTVAGLALGVGRPYSDALGLSGQAFRLQVHRQFCPSSPHSACGAETITRMLASSPFQAERIETDPETNPGHRLRLQVRNAIDAGWPLLYGCEESGLIVGYQEEAWVCLHPYHGSRERFLETKTPWVIQVLSVRSDPAITPQQIEEALMCAAAFLNAEASGAYLLGKAAWEHWIRAVREATPETFGEIGHGAFWIYAQLVEARRAAAEFLDRHGKAPEAAAAYRKMVEALEPEGACPVAVCTPPWAKGYPFTASSQQRYVAALERAAEWDDRAVQAILAQG